MGYWTYYLAMLALWYLVDHPAVLVGVVVVFLLRGYIPDPYVFMRTARRMRSLRTQIAANPANVTARRDLARVYLERSRPKRALALLQEARKRHPDDAELLFLTGLAQARSRAYEPALQSLIDAVGIDPRTGFGEPYRAAGDVLMKLERYSDAEDAFEHYVDTNSSAVDGWYKLARARAKQGDDTGAKQALDELRDTWRTLPAYLRRKQWSWRLRSVFAG
jgi:predicted Zn-dependent protease